MIGVFLCLLINIYLNNKVKALIQLAANTLLINNTQPLVLTKFHQLSSAANKFGSKHLLIFNITYVGNVFI